MAWVRDLSAGGQPELAPEMREGLLDGHFFGITTSRGSGLPADMAAVEAAWRAHGAKLVEYWASDPEGHEGTLLEPAPAGPGHRPWGWWAFEAPEPRKRVGGTGEPSDRPWCPAPRLSFGRPAVWETWNADDPPRFETEAAYLDRLDLWLAGERKRAGEFLLVERVQLPSPRETRGRA